MTKSIFYGLSWYRALTPHEKIAVKCELVWCYDFERSAVILKQIPRIYENSSISQEEQNNFVERTLWFAITHYTWIEEANRIKILDKKLKVNNLQRESR